MVSILLCNYKEEKTFISLPNFVEYIFRESDFQNISKLYCIHQAPGISVDLPLQIKRYLLMARYRNLYIQRNNGNTCFGREGVPLLQGIYTVQILTSLVFR